MNIHLNNITVFNTVIIFNLFKSFNLFSTHCFFSYKIIRFQKITVTDTLDKHIKVDFEIKGFDDLSIDGGSLTVTVEVLNTFDRRIQAIVSYRNASDTVIVTLQPKNFAKYGNFYDKNSAWWATGDTLRDPFHTDDEIKKHGRPVFLGYSTSKKGVKNMIKILSLNFTVDSNRE